MGIEKLNTIWPGWKVVDKIGEDAEGKIYRICNNSPVMEYSSVKVITVPSNDAEIISLKNEGMDSSQIVKYYTDKVTEIVEKAKLNNSLIGTPNTAAVQDCKVVRKEQGIGWEIYIKSELLVPLNAYLTCNTMSEADIIKLGIDIATSLEHSEKKNVLHKDIDPDAIYLSLNGNFKLGDYSPSLKGDVGNYTSPEAEKGEYYGAHSDVYSVGIILYTLLNNNRLPFTDPDKTNVGFEERTEAAKRRYSGEELPPPCNASKELSNVIALACSYDPAKRFKTAAALKSALQSVAPLSGAPMIKVDFEKMVGAHAVPVNFGAVVTPKQEFNVNNKEEIAKPVIKKNRKSNKPLIITLISVVSVMLIAGIILAIVLIDGGNGGEQTAESRTGEIMAALVDGNYSYALEIFNETGVDDKLVEELNSHLDTLYNDFLSEKTTYERAKQELDTIEQMNIEDISEKFISTRDKIYQLNDSRAAFERAEESYKKSDFIEAIEDYMLVIKDDPNYTEAQKKINASKGEYRGLVIEECESMEAEDNYLDAIKLIENALKVLENDTELEGKLKSVKTGYEKFVISEAQEMLDEKEYEETEKALKDALDVLPENEAIQAKIDEIPKIIEEDYIEEAEALASKGAYDSAVELLEKALETLEDNEAILAKIEEINGSRPANLTDMSVVDSTVGSVQTLKAGSDAFGGDYKSGIQFTVTEEGEAYAVYNINKKYDKFKAKITLPSTASNESEFTVEVYADGKRIKRIKDYQMSDGSVNLDLSISEKSELEIKVILTSGEKDSLCLTDCVLSKN